MLDPSSSGLRKSVLWGSKILNLSEESLEDSADNSETETHLGVGILWVLKISLHLDLFQVLRHASPSLPE